MTHQERAHALLGASGAERWLNCPPSAKLCEHMADTSNVHSDTGVAAHELAEALLRRRILPCNSKQRKELDAKIEACKANKYYDAEMERLIGEYVTFVAERFSEMKARTGDVLVKLEESLDYAEWVPEGFGTGDVVLVADGTIEIIDLKYGNRLVCAENNPQLRLYALGAWSAYNWLYDINEVRMTIVQPRRDNISAATMSVEDLLEWAETEVKPKALLAYEGKGEYKAGSHCQWCKAKGNCRARADENMKVLAQEFKEPALLSNEEIGSVLFIAEQLKAWATDVEKYALEQARSGNPIPQWKLVEGGSKRFITDKEQAINILLDAGFDENNVLKPRELEGIGKLEKQIGKKKLTELLAGYIVKPAGAPTLVPETDARPELNSIEADFQNMGVL